MAFRDFLSVLVPGFGYDVPVVGRQPYYGADSSLDFFTTLRDENLRSKELNILIGNSVARVKVFLKSFIENDEPRFTCICKVEEIDGRPIPIEEQEEKAERLVLDENDMPYQLQRTILLDTLEKFGLHGNIRPVTEDFVSEHMRVLRLRNRLGEGR